MDIERVISMIRETDSIFFDDRLRKDVKKKGDSDFVTRADIEVSEYLRRRLAETFPHIGFISEEDEWQGRREGDFWILDPIDGTTNFMHRLPFCCISLALFEGDEVTLGVIYSPYTGELFTAEKGKGTYLNGERVYASSSRTLSDSVGLFEFNAYYKNETEQALDHAQRIYTACPDIRTLGSAALEFAYIACGRADVYLGRYLKPWDFAAGMLLVSEAGGRVGGLNKPLDIFEHHQHVISTNSLVFDEFEQLLK